MKRPLLFAVSAVFGLAVLGCFFFAPGALRKGREVRPDMERNMAGLMYEEAPAIGFTDYINQADYALAQTMRRLGVSSAGLSLLSVELREHGGRLYQERHIALAGVGDAAFFARALRDALIAWAERAALLRREDLPAGMRDAAPPSAAGEGEWFIVLDGVITHRLSLSSAPPADRHGASRPRLVIVMDDLGESRQAAARLRALDFKVTFAVWPRGTHAGEVAELAHEQGLEVLVHQPMEPLDYPAVNPGRGAMLAGMGREDILRTLDESLRLVPHASGLNNHMGSLLTQDEGAMRVVAQEARQRGLFILDSLTHQGSRLAGAALQEGARALKRDIFLDEEARRDKVLEQLRRAERISVVRGQAIAIGHPLPATLDALEDWQRLRDQEIEIVRLADLDFLN
ncbi:MAG: divergent polysaccharide deacetylase family protein [Deltaproteobacteria bacterium]|jgi:polysaccharide deacetylase 2 family uncharacterized protein YibQ|nr:divergent polysaccharide deacetylase family protein [Deltaproteobacteria bacterium]